MYEWVENNDPAMFEEIRRISEGRWEIVGGWWIQPDCNIPNGESFVRQGLYGQRYFLEKFGVTAKVGYNVDSFGITAAANFEEKRDGFLYFHASDAKREGIARPVIPMGVQRWEPGYLLPHSVRIFVLGQDLSGTSAAV